MIPYKWPEPIGRGPKWMQEWLTSLLNSVKENVPVADETTIRAERIPQGIMLRANPAGVAAAGSSAHPWKFNLTIVDEEYTAKLDTSVYSALYGVGLEYSELSVTGLDTEFFPVDGDAIYITAEFDFDGAVVDSIDLVCGELPDPIDVNTELTPILWQQYFSVPLVRFIEVEDALIMQEIVNSQLALSFILYNGLPCRFPLPIG